MPLNLLDEPLIEMISADVKLLSTLPGLFAAWGQRLHDIGLDGLRPHQRPAMHMLLCQLAASALDRATDEAGLDADEATWKTRLLRLAPLAAWDLIAAEQSVPAFLQPPVPRSQQDWCGKTADCPDEVTLLVTAKNHSVKWRSITNASPWTWIAALVELQTMCGYPGAKNYGIARMNGGQASRPMVSIYPDMRDGARWTRDVLAITERLDTIQRNAPFFAPRRQGTVATWLNEWDGTTQLLPATLDPLCVEVSRRIRLEMDATGSIHARVGNSTTARIGGIDELKGIFGDPWAPLDGAGTRCLTVGADGWTLRRLRNLIFLSVDNPYVQSPLQKFRTSEAGKPMFLHAAVLTGGQGKTEGFHEITIPIPPHITGIMAIAAAEAQALGDIAAQMIDSADKASRALKYGVLVFVQGGPAADVKFDKPHADPWIALYHRECMQAFFPHLWAAFQAGGDQSAWIKWLMDRARDHFDRATASLPIRSELRYRALARGRSMLNGTLRKAFPPEP